MTKEDVIKAIERGRRLAQQSQSQTGQGVTSSNNSIDKLRESVIRRPLTQAAQQQANRDAERFVQQQNALTGGNMSYNQYQNALNSTRQALNNQYQKEYNNQYDYLTNYTQYDYTGKSREEAEARLNELNRELHTAGSDGHQRAVVQEMTDAQNYIDSLMSVDEVNAKISELKKQRDEISADWQKVQDTTNDFDYYKKRSDLYGTQIKDINNQIDRYSGAVLSNAYAQEDKNLLGALSDEEKQNLSDYYNSLRYITSEEGNLPGKYAQQEWIRQNEIYNNAKKSLEGKYTQEQINRLAEALEYTQNAELRQTMQEDFASMAQNARAMSDKIPQSSFFTSVSSSAPQAFSEGLPILGQTVLEGISTIASPIENTATLIHSLFNERPIDYNDPIYALTNMSNDLSTALVEANADRKLYPIVNGMARVIGSLGGAAIAGGGNAKLVKFFMGNNAASNAALEMAERGGSNADIVGTAIAAAVAEMIFEGTFDRAVGLGDETAKILSSSKPVLEGVKSFFKSIGAEVSEEVATDIANTLYDTIINGDMSDYSMAVNEYIRQGMSEKEAQKQWAKDFGMQLKDTVIISALMGGLLSGGGYIGNGIQARANNQALQILQEAQSLPPQEANALMKGFVNSGQSRAEADAILKQASEVIAMLQSETPITEIATETSVANNVDQSQPIIDTELVKRANNSTLMDMGDIISREYDKNVAKINSLNIPEKTKAEYIKQITDLTNEELSAQTKAVSPYVSGPARLTTDQMTGQSAQRVADINGKINAVIAEAEKLSRNNNRQQQDNILLNAIKYADANNYKAVDVNSTIYYKLRKNWTTTKPKNFTGEVYTFTGNETINTQPEIVSEPTETDIQENVQPIAETPTESTPKPQATQKIEVMQEPEIPQNNGIVDKNSVKSQVMPDLDLESFKGSIESRYLSGEKLTAESVTSARERATNAVRKKSPKETRDYLATYLSDEAYVVDKATRNKQDRIVYEVYTDAKSGKAKALMNMGMQSGNKFIGALTDASGKIVNKSVSELLNPFKNADFNQLGLENPTKSEIKEAQKQYWQDAQDYLYLLHNLDCINNGKPRLIDLSEADTRNRVAELEKAHPEFKSDLIKARNTITDFILQYEIDTGRITQEEADAWQKLYPNYVPTFREFEGEVSQSLLKAGADYNARARAKGSALKLLPLDESIFRKLDHATVYGQRNLFFNQMLKAGMENEQLADNYKILKVIDDVKGMSTREVLGETAKQKNTYIAYTSNGGAIVFQANHNLNVAIEDIVSSQYEVDQYLKTWQAVNRLFRAGVTTANPLFLASNAIRDFQEALYYTSDVKGFLEAYPEAVKQIRENGELYQQFMASGITEVSDVASDGSIKANLKQKLGFIKRANDVVEMLPRFTEYIRTINELGNTYEGRLQASYNAKEITTNFSRGGKFTKFLNRNGFNFLNASVQGGSKFIRQISETIDNGKATGATYAKIAMSSGAVIIKGIMWGMAPQLLNELICSFFEGYDELDDSLKQQYYLIPAKDGDFIRIPKGRAMVVGAVMGNSLVRIAKGEEVDPVEDIKTIWENIGVSKPTGLWTPIVDAMNNRTWYDGTLINQSLSQKPNAEQYDESTDDISKYLGKLFNIPPKAINYVLDQWSGVLGDFLLPMITDKTKGGTLWEYVIANPVKKRFTVDSVTNNKISGEYYDEVNAVKTELKSDNAPANATLVNKYFNEQTDAVNDVWEKIHQIQNYSNLTPIEQKALDSEFKEYGDLSQYKVRTEVIRDSRKIINGIQRNALENLEAVNTVSKEYADKYLVGDYTGTDVNNAYLEMNYDLFGAEYALKNHYGDVYIKAQEANAVGIDYDSYYQYYIATKDLNSKDENGNSVTGLKKERVMEAIESLDLSAGQKAFLFAESGYKLNSSMKSQLWDYIESLKLSASEKQAIYDELTE